MWFILIKYTGNVWKPYTNTIYFKFHMPLKTEIFHKHQERTKNN